MDVIINKNVFDGNHESTKAVMQLMSVNNFKGKKVIDVGCGSGILAIYAAELGARSIIAIDNDSRAVKNTEDNFYRNNIYNANVYWTDFMETDFKADIIIANLPRESGAFCLPKIKQSLNDDGLIITSWFKELTMDFTGVNILDYIEGIEYDCYVLQKK